MVALKEDEQKTHLVKEQLLTGKDILKSFKNGESEGLNKYNQLCRALDLLPNWEEKAKLDFFAEFWGLSDLMDAQCTSLIHKFCRIEWHLLPASIRPSFVELLRNIAIRHVIHTDTVFHSLTSHFVQKMKIASSADGVEFVSILNDDEQERIFELAHSAVASILECFPMAIHMLMESCRDNFPHHSLPDEKYLSYVRNMILLTEYATPIRSKIWAVVLKRLIEIDALLSHAVDENHMISPVISDDSGVFTLDEDRMEIDQVVPNSKQDESLRNKLDRSLLAIFAYISRAYSHASITARDDVLVSKVLEMGEPDFNMLNVFLPAFDEYVLTAHGVQSVPFIWFYLCSLDEKDAAKMLQHLWRTIITPVNSPNEWKKSQNAASFLSGFLGRAKFIKFKVAIKWMERMATWASQYVDQSDITRKFSTAGGIQHGVFYSVVQALLFVFCFRYREIVENDFVDELRQSWGFGKILHSHFEPLKYISSIIAECFSAVSRCVQLLYVNHHMLRTFDYSQQLMPIEPYFPFSFLQLPKCDQVVGESLRIFRPAEEDKATIAKDLSFKKVRSRHQISTNDDFDFMNADDLNLESRDAVRTALSESPFLALASTTPA